MVVLCIWDMLAHAIIVWALKGCFQLRFHLKERIRFEFSMSSRGQTYISFFIHHFTYFICRYKGHTVGSRLEKYMKQYLYFLFLENCNVRHVQHCDYWVSPNHRLKLFQIVNYHKFNGQSTELSNNCHLLLKQ